MRNLEPGEYEIRRMDVRTKNASKTKAIKLKEFRTDNGINYTIYEITLNASQGNSKITPICQRLLKSKPKTTANLMQSWTPEYATSAQKSLLNLPPRSVFIALLLLTSHICLKETPECLSGTITPAIFWASKST